MSDWPDNIGECSSPSAESLRQGSLDGVLGGVSMDIDRSRRDPLDRFFTPLWVTLIAIDILGLRASRPKHILEPFAGRRLAIARPLALFGHWVETTDIDLSAPVHRHGDAFSLDYDEADHVVTNSPYETENYHAVDAVEKFRALARESSAFLLPLTFFEPCDNRARELEAHPPSEAYVLPRFSFYGTTGAPSTVMWCVYRRRSHGHTKTITLSRSKCEPYKLEAAHIKRGLKL